MDILFTDALKLKRPNAFNVMLKPAGSSCNLNCTYCYYLEKKKLYPGKIDYKMSDELLEKFTKQYIEEHQVPVVTFTWQGGEPTLMGLDFFKRSINIAGKYKKPGTTIANTMQTNGILIDDEWCEFFKASCNFSSGICDLISIIASAFCRSTDTFNTPSVFLRASST